MEFGTVLCSSLEGRGFLGSRSTEVDVGSWPASERQGAGTVHGHGEFAIPPACTSAIGYERMKGRKHQEKWQPEEARCRRNTWDGVPHTHGALAGRKSAVQVWHPCEGQVYNTKTFALISGVKDGGSLSNIPIVLCPQ